MAFTVTRYQDVNEFAEHAFPWLLQAEAENNLLLSIVEHIRARRPGYGHPYLATVQENNNIVGCAFRTPPYKFGVTRMPHGAIPALVNDVLDVYDDLPAVLGPAPQARAFAEAWAISHGQTVKQGLRSRIYQLDRVIPPSQPAPGHVRLATRDDLELAIGWLSEFAQETHSGAPSGRVFAENHIAGRSFFIWEHDGVPRSAAVYAGKTPHGVRIGFVYTPRAERGHGYASACVAAVSQQALDGGNRFCCLYTDLANPTSNRIYQAIGYQPVCDVTDYEIS